MIVEGAIAVKAVINSEKRLVRKVYIRKDKKTKDFNYIRKLCRNKNIILEELESAMLEEYTKGKSHLRSHSRATPTPRAQIPTVGLEQGCSFP